MRNGVGQLEAHSDELLASFEGLVFSTARRYAPFVQDEFEDICQLLRIKVFKALLAYDATKYDTPEVKHAGRSRIERWVYGAVKNGAKDLLKKRVRQEDFLDDLAPQLISSDGDRSRLQSRDRFEQDNGMATTHDQVYGTIDDDDLLVPNTLTLEERRIVVLLYRDYRQSEIARRLGLAKKDMECAMKSIRAKMGDWRPTGVVLVFVSDRQREFAQAA